MYRLLIVFLLVGCGDSQVFVDNVMGIKTPRSYIGVPDRLWGESVSVPPELQPYFADFIHELMERRISAHLAIDSISFGPTRYYHDIGGYALAECVTEFYENPTRIVDAKVVFHYTLWNLYKDNPVAIRWVMYHELGHCMLNQDHTNDRINVMNSFVPIRNDLSDVPWFDMEQRFFGRGLVR